MILRNFSPLHDYVPWMADCHNASHILLDSWEFHNQIASHEGCISFHAVKCCDLALSLTTLQSSVNLPCKISVISIKGRLWHKGLPHMITIIIVHSTQYLFSDWLKAYCKCSRSAPGTSSTIIMSRKFKVTGNHVMYDHLFQLGVSDNIPYRNYLIFFMLSQIRVISEIKTLKI